MRSSFLGFALIIATVARAEQPPQYIATNRSDSRVVAVATLTIQSDTLSDKPSNKFYFVPLSAATKAEQKENRGFAPWASIKVKGTPKGRQLYDISLISATDAILVEIDTERIEDPSLRIEREASFYVPFFIDSSGKKAGIQYSIVWTKKPNHLPEPTPGAVH